GHVPRPGYRSASLPRSGCRHRRNVAMRARWAYLQYCSPYKHCGIPRWAHTTHTYTHTHMRTHAQTHTHTHTHTYTHAHARTHTYTQLSLSLSLFLSLCLSLSLF